MRAVSAEQRNPGLAVGLERKDEPHRDFYSLQVQAGGRALAARHYPASPFSGAARGAVLIVPAMGVPQSFYARLARWLSGQGFHALSFDYRGMGESREGSLARLEADLVTWGEVDTQAALDALRDRAPGLPITWLGHSLGGQLVPFTRDRARVAKVVTVAAGSGYWRENAPPLRRKVWIFWGLAVPLLTPLFGYFPGAPLGMVGDLPRGVALQWRKWCLSPEYAASAEGEAVRAAFAGVETPITSISFTDDEMMSEANIRSLHGLYVGARHRAHRIDPRSIGLGRVGHFGFFKEEMKERLWEQYLRPELAARPAAGG